MFSIRCCVKTVALNYGEIKKDSQRITAIKPFINKYNWKVINFPPEKDDWKKFEKKKQQLLFMFCMLKKFWLATCARKPKVPGSRLAASYVQR